MMTPAFAKPSIDSDAVSIWPNFGQFISPQLSSLPPQFATDMNSNYNSLQELDRSGSSKPLLCNISNGFASPVPTPIISQKVVSRPAIRLDDQKSMEIITTLYKYQLNDTQESVDLTLVTARQGIEIVMDCIAHKEDLFAIEGPSASSTLALACIHIVQQAFACYLNLKAQLAEDEIKAGDDVQIGAFKVQGVEMRKSVLRIILAKELSSCKDVAGALKQWTTELERTGNGDKGILKPFMGILQC